MANPAPAPALEATVFETACRRPGSTRWETSREANFRFEQNLCLAEGSLGSIAARSMLVPAPGSSATQVATEQQFLDALRQVVQQARGRDHEFSTRHPAIFASTIPRSRAESAFTLAGLPDPAQGDKLTPVMDMSGNALPGAVEVARTNPLLLFAPRVLWGSVSIGPMVNPRDSDYRISYPWNLFEPLVGTGINDFVVRAVQDMFSDYDATADSMTWMERQNFSLVRVLKHLGYTDLQKVTKVWVQVTFNGVSNHMQVWPKAGAYSFVSRFGDSQYGADFHDLFDVAKANDYRMPHLHVSIIVSGVPLPQPPAPGDPKPPPMPTPAPLPPSPSSSSSDSSPITSQWWFWLLVVLGAMVVLAIISSIGGQIQDIRGVNNPTNDNRPTIAMAPPLPPAPVTPPPQFMAQPQSEPHLRRRMNNPPSPRQI